MWSVRVLERRMATWPKAALDVPLAVAFTIVALLLARERPPEGWWWARPDALGYALICAVNLTVAARRLAPRLVFAAATALWLVYIAAGFWPVVNSGALMLAFYTVAATCRTADAAVCGATFAAVWITGALLSRSNGLATATGQALVVPFLLWKFGDTARQLAARNRTLSELTVQLRREREENARRAVAEERVRIARELHDVVAHHMSVISVQAGLAQYVFTTDRDTAHDALGTISAASGEALEELRRLLAVLRVGPEGVGESPGDQPYRPTPGLDRLAETADRVRAAGVAVELRVVGERRPLPQGPDLCAYRVVQEALTNVIKHARSARATVRVEYLPRQLRVSVTDDGVGNVPANPGPPGGHGLIGMRERARIYGGTLAAGPRAGGGFEVRLTLPLQPVPQGRRTGGDGRGDDRQRGEDHEP
ncbi:ATPase [Streptomyces mashuensis]|uniref:histidine kinase n=1 Tax=Streptomyces mashuensis TaxID=33904 RepID=A0A919EGB4_9ACTN|nr:sensor histidine kinase [Streptomyces mashuensis]GHF73754.1 ATPase [Streptomyces mashuensis]